jgi:glycosyltransferase involved in cell wall biosynthesis
MDVAFVSNVVYPFVTGGAEKRIHEIGRRLAADGHRVTVYGRQFWDGPAETTSEGMTLRGVAPGVELYNDDGQRSIIEAISFAGRLVPDLRRHATSHDVVVASVFPYFPVLSTKLCLLSTETPLVTTWHEVWVDYWDEYLGRLALGGKAIEYATARTPQHPIAVSGVTADRLAAIGPPREDIEIVPNGIDVEQVRTAPLPKRPFHVDGRPGFDVLFAGRLIADKRVDVLLDAFDRVAARHDASLGIIGDGPQADTLREQARTLRHGDRVTFLGFVDEYEAVLGHMRAARVFAAPSTREGFGIAYAEALAADCTVVAADHPKSAADEVIGDAGYLADPSVDGVAEALGRALDGERPPVDPTERAERFDWDAVADQAAATYRRAIEGE